MERDRPPLDDEKNRARRRRPATGPVPVSDVIAEALADCGLGERLEQITALRAWSEVVGDKIARHSRVVNLENGVLTLDADHGAWRQELTLLWPLIKDRYNQRFGSGTVKEIRWHRAWDRRQRFDEQE
jgi:predicted nucleic acid-binding Zn ribbon protein